MVYEGSRADKIVNMGTGFTNIWSNTNHCIYYMEVSIVAGRRAERWDIRMIETEESGSTG